MNHQPLSASLAASFAIHPLFPLSGALKATSSVSFSSGVPFQLSVYRLFFFRLPIQLGSTKPPTFRRSSPIRNPPRSLLCEPDPCLADRRLFHFSNVRIESVSLPLPAVCLPGTKLSRLSSRKQQHQTRDLY